MNVFKRGLFIILIDGNDEEFIPIESLYYRVSNDIVVFVNYDNANTYTSAVSDIKNEAGGAVGNAAAVSVYLQGLTESDSGVANSPSQQQLTDPSSVTVAGWKTLSFACSGTITVTIDGNAIIYPFTLGASTVLGASYTADTVTANSVSFDGTGTVLITTQQ